MTEGASEPGRKGGRGEPRVAGSSSEPGRHGLASQMSWAIVSANVLALVALVLGAVVLVLHITEGGGAGGAPAVALPTATVQPTPTASAITNELQALGNEWAQTVAKVGYDLTVTSGGTSDVSSLTLYRQPPDWRLDISSSSQGDEILIATGGDTLYDCSAQSGENQCLFYDASQVDIPGLLGIFDPSATANSVAGENVDRSEQTISGEAATCFSVTSTSGGTTSNSEWCFASDGILLRLVATSDDPSTGDLTIETTGVNRDVTEADFDFQPPYPVTTPTPAASPTPSEAPASPTPSGAEASPTPAQ
jgi:outer membrane lipoprotein-sorting protein